VSENEEVVTQKIEAMLDAMWKSSAAAIAERVGSLRTVQARLAGGALDPVDRKEAQSAAHKLAGILGTFGLPQGSILASKIERLMTQPGAIDAPHRALFSSWLDELETEIRSKHE
jgi:HPt (histidine-containing phosphotransfer) domain-containing protein